MTHYAKALVALIPLVTTLIVHFAGADSDISFVWATVVTALTAGGVYLVPNSVR